MAERSISWFPGRPSSKRELAENIYENIYCGHVSDNAVKSSILTSYRPRMGNFSAVSMVTCVQGCKAVT